MRWYIILLLSVFFLSCSKHEKETLGYNLYNLNTPSEPNFNIKISSKFNIDEFNEALDDKNRFIDGSFCQASNGNYYFPSRSNNGLIKIYSPSGKYLKSFSQRGTGPGEAKYYIQVLSIGDKIYAYTNAGFFINVFNLNGEFIKSINVESIQYIVKASDNRIVGLKGVIKRITKDNTLDAKYDIILFDSLFNEIKTIEQKRKIFKEDQANSIKSTFFPYICANKENVYISWLSKNEYKISSYSTNNGKPLYGIKKATRTKYYNDQEMNSFSEYNGFDMKKKYGKLQKRVINYIKCDKKNRLWVFSTQERNKENISFLYADLYKDGKFINTIILPQLYFRDTGSAISTYEVSFVGNKMYYVNTDVENDKLGRIVEAYDY